MAEMALCGFDLSGVPAVLLYLARLVPKLQRCAGISARIIGYLDPPKDLRTY
jgi:hypothetical protein